MNRLRGSLYATTYPGIGLGVVAEWVAHDQPGCGVLEVTVALPFFTLNAHLTRYPPPPAPLRLPHGTPAVRVPHPQRRTTR